MDDYMREMVDLKTLVTKTLEKKGVLARIRAELRANVFQAMEEQDHEAESNGSTTFSILGTCNERAKKLHTSPSGKLLMALVCEYMEWCELDHTLKVYMPELNQPRAYNRAELVDILGLGGEAKAESQDSGPLLLSMVESFLNEKDTSASGPAAQAKQTRHGVAGGPRQFSGNSSGVVDPSEALEARVSMSSKKSSEKSMGGSHDGPIQSRLEAEPVGAANNGTMSPRLSDDSQKLYEKSSNRAQALLAELPQHRRSSGLPGFSGMSRSGPNTRGSNNGSANDHQTAVAGVDSGGSYPRGARDSDNDGKRREYSWSEEDELQGGSSVNRKNEGGWRDEDYDKLYTNPAARTEKGDGKGQVGEDSSSQGRRASSMENSSKALGNLHLADDDSASEFGGHQSSGSRGTPTRQQWQGAPRENSAAAASGGSKKQASAYFYSDSEEENAPEIPDERFEF
ncbi:hypothetical protein KC19_2G222300 [Ceratodon purpureus]|uniref:FGFR1 oncogene partner (FOP) N-terminal dimerisation domain-containing protein n=1 Tax=Ceratodon purpureus TaxID=3225 RepID=A0A8T0IYA3_CERPU|nr:hypothetical protein KC19_2G222300 [Ceratodon purpureus]